MAVEDTLERKDHIVCIQLARGGKPRRMLKRNVITQTETVSCAVVQHLPAFRQLRHQTVGVRINIKQTVVKLSGEYPQSGRCPLLWVEGINLSADAVDEATVTNIRLLSWLGAAKAATEQTECKDDKTRRIIFKV